MITINTPIAELPRVSLTHAKKLEKLSIFTVKDLLLHFPSRYEDFATTFPIAELSADSNATVVGEISHVKTNHIYKRHLTVTSATISDNTGSVSLVWFNQPFIEKSLSEGKKYRVSGKVIHNDKSGLHFSAPSIEREERLPTSTGRLVPIYPETAGITSKWLRWQIAMIMEKKILPDEMLPFKILSELSLPTIKTALKLIHFPKTVEEATYAHKRFIFEEMLILQLITLRTRAQLTREKASPIPFDEKLIQQFVASLPFTPTDAQRKCAFQILTDISKPTPMNRLLNGDVGAGKTLVAAIAALQCASAGHQVAILAPTEILARQHFSTLLTFFERYNFSIGLLTGAYKMHGTHPALVQDITRPRMLDQIKKGKIKIIVGTHAVIQEDVQFKDLALIIIDEQHRFGVAQRAKLSQKSIESHDGNKKSVPHFLTMTATPIPRTFALALFGDLHVSLLDEKPLERKEIKTSVVSPDKRDIVYGFIKKEITAGRQAYIILPLVEESDALKDIKAATEEYELLSRTIFADHSLGLMHGRLKAKEKERLMTDFKNKKIDILISTSVVEVGVDVPNATVMIIENAERFGLSQLHQFRGRIGRGTHQSHCFLFSEQFYSQRLKALEKYTDGFKLAEIDLKLRGPGEFLGSQQSGLPDGAMQNISNIKLVNLTRKYAKEILTTDPLFKKHPQLRDTIDRYYANIHME
jgi:ATP-dependent DNA helicase RecG